MEILLWVGLFTHIFVLMISYVMGYRKGRGVVDTSDTMLNAYKARTEAMLKIAGKK